MRETRRDVACRVDRAEALRYMGHNGQDIPAELGERIDRAIARCEEVARPAWCCWSFPLVHEGGKALLEGSTVTLPERGGSAPTARACACVLMACTIGLSHEREAYRLSASDTTAALIFDAAGSSLVESCADDCERAVFRFAGERGLHAGQRMSPGYGELPLELSVDIVRALGADKALGLTFTESGMLVPMKSVTAIVPLFEDERDARRARRSCADCIVAPHCPYLKTGNICYE